MWGSAQDSGMGASDPQRSFVLGSGNPHRPDPWSGFFRPLLISLSNTHTFPGKLAEKGHINPYHVPRSFLQTALRKFSTHHRLVTGGDFLFTFIFFDNFLVAFVIIIIIISFITSPPSHPPTSSLPQVRSSCFPFRKCCF